MFEVYETIATLGTSDHKIGKYIEIYDTIVTL